MKQCGYSLLAGGKRLRPILISSTYELFKKDSTKCIPFMVAMEMVHTFSLIHDDLPAIDNDDYRRGKLTNHKKFNEATAILAGDSLFAKSFELLSQSAEDNIAYIDQGSLKLYEEKDCLIEQYGILKCSKEELKEFDEQAVKGVRENPYGVEALVDRSKMPKDYETDMATLEEIIVFLSKGQEE